ncbi:MAG TPA: hypothetical protein VFT58_01435 [Nitrososphaera sp.]|nr:hypothetical protein [Nitrososphaera sp.]
MGSRPIGGYFGRAAVELVGMVFHPDHQNRDHGKEMVERFIKEEQPARLIGYTRNPGVVRMLAGASGREDILSHDDPAAVALEVPNATVGPDGHLYHIGRYAPHGLYGSYDPADRPLQKEGATSLREICTLLDDPNNALALSIDLRGEQG